MSFKIKVKNEEYGFVSEKNGYTAYRSIDLRRKISKVKEAIVKRAEKEFQKELKKLDFGKKEIVLDKNGKVVSNNIKEFWDTL